MWSGINRRRFPRAEYPCRITIYTKDAPQIFSTRTQNIGEGGVCVILDKELKLFSVVGLELFLENGHAPLNCTGRVVWVVKKRGSKPDAGVMFDTGIEFADVKNQDKERVRILVEKIAKQDDS